MLVMCTVMCWTKYVSVLFRVWQWSKWFRWQQWGHWRKTVMLLYFRTCWECLQNQMCVRVVWTWRVICDTSFCCLHDNCSEIMSPGYFHIYVYKCFFPPDVTLPSCLDGSPGSPETLTEGRLQRSHQCPNLCRSSSSAFTNVFQEVMAIYTQLNVRATEMMVSHNIQTQWEKCVCVTVLVIGR